MSFFNFPIPAPPVIPTDSVYKTSKISSLYPIETIGPYTTWKLPVVAATTADISLTGTPTVDGVVLALGDRVLVKNQVNGADNGIYIVNAQVWLRSNDLGKDTNASALCVFVNEGTINKNTAFLCSNQGPCIVGVDVLTFIPVAGSGFSTNPAPPVNSVQYNNAGAFGGSSNLTYNGTDTLTVTGTVTGLIAPTNPSDAANKAYVDSLSGTPAAPVNSIQYNDAGAFGGSSKLLVSTTGSPLPGSIPLSPDGEITLGSTIAPNLTGVIRGASTTTPGEDGCSMFLVGGNSLDSLGGYTGILGGDSTTSGGPISITAGNSTINGFGGVIELAAGNSSGANPGNYALLRGGNAGTNGDGGTVSLRAGDAGSISGNGGDAAIVATDATVGGGGNGGNIEIRTGAKDMAGVNGTLSFFIGGNSNGTQYIWPTADPTIGQSLQVTSVVPGPPVVVTLTWV